MLPTEATDAIDPADAIDAIDPAEPIERIEPDELTHRIEPDELIDHSDPRPALSRFGRRRRVGRWPSHGEGVTIGWPAGERTYQSPPALVRACPVALPGARSGGQR